MNLPQPPNVPSGPGHQVAIRINPPTERRTLSLEECVSGTELLWQNPNWELGGWTDFVPPVVRQNWDRLPIAAKWAAWVTADYSEHKANR